MRRARRPLPARARVRTAAGTATTRGAGGRRTPGDSLSRPAVARQYSRHTAMSFPQTRLRRLRATRALRGLVRETRLEAADFVYPMFVAHGIDRREPIAEMPGVDHLSIAHAVDEAGEAQALGIPAVLLFGLPASKDEEGSGAWDEEGVVQLATRAIKEAHPDLIVITDLCMCEYTSHGHCGVLKPDGTVDNDATLEFLARTATSQAKAGADIVAPSDMMDGRVGAIRHALDEDGHTDTPILAYSAKFASSRAWRI